MGAKFTRLQPAQVAWMEDGKIKVKNMYGALTTIETPLKMSFRPDKSNFLHENVFVELTDDGLLFVLRRDFTWSLYEKDTKLLLDFGFVAWEGPALFDIEYAPIGFIRAQKIVFPLVLDLSTKRVAHGMLEEGMPNGYDVYFNKEVPYNVNEEVDSQYSRSLALYEAMNTKMESVSVFVYNIEGEPLNAAYRVVNRAGS